MKTFTQEAKLRIMIVLGQKVKRNPESESYLSFQHYYFFILSFIIANIMVNLHIIESMINTAYQDLYFWLLCLLFIIISIFITPID